MHFMDIFSAARTLPGDALAAVLAAQRFAVVFIKQLADQRLFHPDLQENRSPGLEFSRDLVELHLGDETGNRRCGVAISVNRQPGPDAVRRDTHPSGKLGDTIIDDNKIPFFTGIFYPRNIGP